MIELATAFGLGGLLGAVAALITQTSRLPESFRRTVEALNTAIVDQNDESATNARRRLQEFQDDFGAVLAAIDKLRRMLRIR